MYTNEQATQETDNVSPMYSHANTLGNVAVSGFWVSEVVLQLF